MLRAAGLRAALLSAAGLRAAGLRTAGLRAAGLSPAGLRAPLPPVLWTPRAPALGELSRRAADPLRLPCSSGGFRGELTGRPSDLASPRCGLRFFRRVRVGASLPWRCCGELFFAGLSAGSASSGAFCSSAESTSFRRLRFFRFLPALHFLSRPSDFAASSELRSASSDLFLATSLLCFRFFLGLARLPSPPSASLPFSSGAFRRRLFLPGLRLPRPLPAPSAASARPLASRGRSSSSSEGCSSGSGAKLSAARFTFRRRPRRSLRPPAPAPAASASLTRPSGGPRTPEADRAGERDFEHAGERAGEELIGDGRCAALAAGGSCHRTPSSPEEWGGG